jgi:methyl-accepting chemotaxis protein
VATEVGKSLSAIVGQATKVSDLISGISKASQEQAQGVDQVNTAVSQMDKVTQQNAAGAEESASAAEELSAQAATVKSMVDELSALVGGKRGNAKATSTAAPPRKATKQHKFNVAHLKQKPHPVPAPVGAATDSGSSDDEFMALEDKGLNEF